MRKNKLTFEEFIEKIYGLDWAQYNALNKYQKIAIDVDYQERYGR